MHIRARFFSLIVVLLDYRKHIRPYFEINKRIILFNHFKNDHFYSCLLIFWKNSQYDFGNIHCQSSLTPVLSNPCLTLYFV